MNPAIVLALQLFGASELLRNGDGRNDAFAAVARFDNCTGFLVRPKASTPDSARAYLLTAGHCIDQSVTAVVRDRAVARTVIFHYFADTEARQVRIPAVRAAYSTMKGTDLAVVELAATIGELARQSIVPFRLAAAGAEAGEPVLSAGVPVTNIPDGEKFVRASRCTLGETAEVIEARWHWWSLHRTDCSDIWGGSSGSPLISRRSGEVVGMITTTNAGAAITEGDFRCSIGQPCEVVRGGFRYRAGTVYAVPVAGLPDCFRETGEFDVALTGCPLDPGRQLNVSNAAIAARPGAAWSAAISGTDFPRFRYKIVNEGEGDCRDPAGYSSPLPVEAGARITDRLPEREGRQHLCVIGVGSQPEQEPRFATLIHLRADATPPVIRPRFLMMEEPGRLHFQPVFVLPELGRYRYKVAGPDGEDCSDRESFREYLRVPIRVPRETVGRICLYGLDEAENPTPTVDLPMRGVNLFAGGVVNAASYGPVAPGSIVSIFGSNLSDEPVVLTDSAGAKSTLRVLYTDPLQINAVAPAGAAPGPAWIEHAGARVEFKIEPVSPGLFQGGGTLPDGTLLLAGTGFGTGPVELRVSGVRAEATVRRSEHAEGLDLLEARLPVRLRGWAPVQSAGNTIWLLLR